MFDLAEFIKTIGYLGLFGIIFAESGLFVGFFLPGDSLLFTAGILASQHFLGITEVVIACFLGAVLGDSFGYYFGAKVGPKLFNRESSLFFDKKHLARAQAFYEKYGGLTIILSRFTPIVRTFAPILAGVGKMQYTTFLTYNLVGAMIWAIGIPLLGYKLGTTIPHIDRYLLPVIIGIIVLSILPGLIHLAKDKEARQHVTGWFTRK